MFSGGASALLLVLSVLAALTPGAWASPEEHVEEYYGADAARSAPAASPPKESFASDQQRIDALSDAVGRLSLEPCTVGLSAV